MSTTQTLIDDPVAAVAPALAGLRLEPEPKSHANPASNAEAEAKPALPASDLPALA